jgi:hypothetical protein
VDVPCGPTDQERAEARSLGLSLDGLGPEDRGIAEYMGISLIELTEINTYFGNRLTRQEAASLRGSVRWTETRQAIARGHQARIWGRRTRQWLMPAVFVVGLVLVLLVFRCTAGALG